MRSRTIKGSPQRSASAAWAEVEAMVLETLAPAAAINDADVRAALDALDGLGPMLVAVGVLAEAPLVLRALPLHLDINVAMGGAALKGEERLGKVSGAASATEWQLYVPDPEPYRAEVRAAVASHAALRAGKAPDEPAQAASSADLPIVADALRRLSGSAR